MINQDYRFDSIDFAEMQRWIRLSPAQRLETMLKARELAVGLIRDQLSKRYPESILARIESQSVTGDRTA